MNPMLMMIAVTALSTLAGAPAPAALDMAAPTTLASVDEYEIKAAYLYNFAKLVEWPDGVLDEGAITLCFDGNYDVARSLASYNRKLIGDRRLVVRRLDAGGTAGCNILYLAAPGAESVVSAVRSECALTVGEMPGFTEMGGIINFTIRDNKLRFQINEAAAEELGLKIRPQLLRAAVEV